MRLYGDRFHGISDSDKSIVKRKVFRKILGFLVERRHWESEFAKSIVMRTRMNSFKTIGSLFNIRFIHFKGKSLIPEVSVSLTR